jgi:hypothetical protein
LSTRLPEAFKVPEFPKIEGWRGKLRFNPYISGPRNLVPPLLEEPVCLLPTVTDIVSVAGWSTLAGDASL